MGGNLTQLEGNLQIDDDFAILFTTGSLMFGTSYVSRQVPVRKKWMDEFPHLEPTSESSRLAVAFLFLDTEMN